jgi:hypothetical protein
VLLFERALAVGRELGDSIGSSYTLRSLGQIAGRRGDHAAATGYLRERLIRSRRVEDQWNLADAVEGLAWVAGAQHQAERAVRLYGAAEAVREARGLLLNGERRARLQRRVRISGKALGEAQFMAAWTAGRAMTPDQAIAYALEAPASNPYNAAAAPVRRAPTAANRRRTRR